MGLLQRFFGIKPVNTPEERGVVTTTWSEYVDSWNSNNVSVNNGESALRSTTVYACVNAISSDIATMSWNVYEKDGKNRIPATDHEVYPLISKEPYFLYSSVQFFKALIANYLLRGNGYALIDRNTRGRVNNLILLDPREVEIEHDTEKKQLFYMVKGDHEGVYDHNEIIHISDLNLNGYEGMSKISLARKNIEYNIAGIQHGKDFLDNSVKLGGYIQYPETLTTDRAKQMRETFVNAYKDAKGGIAVLGDDAKFSPFNYSMTMVDSQFIESMKFSTAEIARMFRVPLHKIGELDRSTNNNIEKQSIEYVMDCLRPIVVMVESEFNRKVFITRRDDNKYIKCNMNALLRGDMESRGKFYESLNKVRAITPNEIRALEDMNPLTDGDRRAWDLNTVPSDLVDDWYNSKIEQENGSE